MAHSMKRQTRFTGIQRWGWRLAFPPMLRDDAADLFAFLAKQNGQGETWTLPAPPPHDSPRGVATGTPLAAGVAAVGDTAIATDGWTPTITGIMRPMDFLRFSGHSKVYQVNDSADSDGSGAATLNIFPPLLEPLADNEGITVANVNFEVALLTDILRIGIEPIIYSGLNIEVIEDY